MAFVPSLAVVQTVMWPQLQVRGVDQSKFALVSHQVNAWVHVDAYELVSDVQGGKTMEFASFSVKD